MGTRGNAALIAMIYHMHGRTHHENLREPNVSTTKLVIRAT